MNLHFHPVVWTNVQPKHLSEFHSPKEKGGQTFPWTAQSQCDTVLNRASLGHGGQRHCWCLPSSSLSNAPPEEKQGKCDYFYYKLCISFSSSIHYLCYFLVGLSCGFWPRGPLDIVQTRWSHNGYKKYWVGSYQPFHWWKEVRPFWSPKRLQCV